MYIPLPIEHPPQRPPNTKPSKRPTQNHSIAMEDLKPTLLQPMQQQDIQTKRIPQKTHR